MTDERLIWEGAAGGAIRLRDEGPIRRIILDRPRQKNAISADMWLALAEAVRVTPGGDVKLILLESAVDGIFSAGADLSEFRRAAEDEAFCQRIVFAMREGLDTVMRAPVVTIAMMRGDAYGAGLGLALSCDLRLAAEDAKMAITAVRMGLAYPLEDIERLIRIAGEGLARELLLTGRTIRAEEAARHGLITRCAPAEKTDDMVQETLAALAHSVAGSILRLKALMDLSFRGEGVKAEADRLFREAFASKTFKERLAAFEKRKR